MLVLLSNEINRLSTRIGKPLQVSARFDVLLSEPFCSPRDLPRNLTIRFAY